MTPVVCGCETFKIIDVIAWNCSTTGNFWMPFHKLEQRKKTT